MAAATASTKPEAEVARLGEAAAQAGGRPLQIIKIDLETNSVVLGEEEIAQLEMALKRTGLQKVAVVGVMGAFRTGKSFLLDLMLRYLRHTSAESPGEVGAQEDCEVPAWMIEREVPGWAIQCGDSIVEGREGAGAQEREGFIWRPGMEKCTEGVWVWSEAFIRKSGDEDVAVLLMDTQGAWDARMTKEQSATVFGLTTLMTSRLIYNVSKQVQQDKIDNLLYFTDFAQAALRAKQKSVNISSSDQQMRPFQTLEFLVRDWPHYLDGSSTTAGRDMMVSHLAQYMDPKVSEDTTSMDALREMFSDIDIWCLPHPSLMIERQSWEGELAVIEPAFWRFTDAYMERIFSPAELRVKASLGAPVTVDTFVSVIREFILAFRNAAPQAQTFAEAMETSTLLLARDSAMRGLKRVMEERVAGDAIGPEAFEDLATEAAGGVEQEFGSKALFGTEESIRSAKEALKLEVSEELQRYRDENERRLEASLSGLTNISLAGVMAFAVDRLSDLTCDWWSSACRDLSQDLSYGYVGILLYVAYCVNNVQKEQGQLSATVATFELGKSMVKRAKRLSESMK